jgi:hypothetical protein
MALLRGFQTADAQRLIALTVAPPSTIRPVPVI